MSKASGNKVEIPKISIMFIPFIANNRSMQLLSSMVIQLSNVKQFDIVCTIKLPAWKPRKKTLEIAKVKDKILRDKGKIIINFACRVYLAEFSRSK